MDCALSMLLTCLSWSNLYVDSGLQYQDAGVITVNNEAAYVLRDGSYDLNRQSVKIDDSPTNPYGRLAVGYEVSFHVLTWRLEASHVSSIATGRDRGVNSVSLSARWYPFRSR